jgi:hypothetical protein
MTDRAPGSRLTYTLVLLSCLAVSLFCVVYPIYVIRPFRHQGALELAVALVVTRIRAVITAVSAIAAIAALIGYWRGRPAMWRRVLQTGGALMVVALALLARINIYELMFHPAGTPVISAASESKLDGGEMVIAVKLNGSARAYPIRSMSYHHIYNDVVAGEPIVATY